MKAKKLMPIAAVAGLLLVGGGLGASAANASNSVSYNSSGVTRITTAYNSSTDILSVYDASSDGYGGRTLYSLSNGSASNLDNSGGLGSTTTRGIGGSGTITFNACIKNGATTVGCTGNVSSSL